MGILFDVLVQYLIVTDLDPNTVLRVLMLESRDNLIDNGDLKVEVWPSHCKHQTVVCGWWFLVSHMSIFGFNIHYWWLNTAALFVIICLVTAVLADKLSSK